jgi:hypothetical protein
MKPGLICPPEMSSDPKASNEKGNRLILYVMLIWLILSLKTAFD